jgi:hypothetical protein
VVGRGPDGGLAAGVPALPAPGRGAAAARAGVVLGGAALDVADVDAGGLGLAVGGHRMASWGRVRRPYARGRRGAAGGSRNVRASALAGLERHRLTAPRARRDGPHPSPAPTAETRRLSRSARIAQGRRARATPLRPPRVGWRAQLSPRHRSAGLDVRRGRSLGPDSVIALRARYSSFRLLPGSPRHLHQCCEFSRTHRSSSAGGTSTSCPHGTTRMNGWTFFSKWSTLIPRLSAASRRV